MAYDHKTIEKKWQRYWKKNKTFKAEINKDQRSTMLWTCSHTHLDKVCTLVTQKATATDVVSRMKRMQGYNVASNGLGCVWSAG